MRKILIKVALAIIIIASGIGLIFIMNKYIIPNVNEESNQNETTPVAEYNINIIITDRNGNILNDDKILTHSKSLIEVLEENYEIRYEREGVGIFLYDIGPIKTDKWNSYIGIYVNDKYSNYGIDKINLYDGIKIEFRETKI